MKMNRIIKHESGRFTFFFIFELPFSTATHMSTLSDNLCSLQYQMESQKNSYDLQTVIKKVLTINASHKLSKRTILELKIN